MGISKIKNLILSHLPFYRWHPEVAIRYLPIVGEIKKLKKPSVLEVGSGGLGIAPYLGRKVTGVDAKFAPPFHPLLEKIVGSGEALPFPDKSFDVVISVDTLEHVASKNRPMVISEMCRVAKLEVIVAVPTGEKAIEQDKQLAKAYQNLHGRPYTYLTEQIRFGLPKVSEIKLAIGDNVRMENNESLAIRNFLMRGWMRPDMLSKVFYWKVLLLVIPFLGLFSQPPYYRSIFFKKI